MSRQPTATPNDLATFDLDGLKRLWTSLFPSPAPSRMPREFLIKLLAQGLQERAIGGLPKTLERQLGNVLNDGREMASPDASSSHLTLGTRLIRGWGGTHHEVTVIDRGFAYRGAAYRSLSEIARLITGAHWSGPRFFGIKPSADSQASPRKRA